MNSLIILSLTGVALMFMGLVAKMKDWLLTLALFGLMGAWVFTVLDWNTYDVLFNNLIAIDNYSVTMMALMLSLGVLILLLTDNVEFDNFKHRAEVYALFAFALVGAFMMVCYANLMMLFIGVEILSISMYILAGYRKHDLMSNEASLKYFLMGAFASALMLMGIALMYGMSGSFGVKGLAVFGAGLGNNLPPLFLLGVLLTILALSFKVGAAPFHFWTPDVYQGSPAVVTAFMSSVVKIASMGAFMRLVYNCFYFSTALITPTLLGIIALTLVIGNLLATKQTNFKRMLAYSSIAQVAFMLMPLLAIINPHSNSVLLFYLMAYSVASVAAFAVLILVKQKTGSSDIAALSGLGRNNPILAFSLTVAMCSMAGIPLTAGFLAKFYALQAILEQGHLWLAIMAVLFSAVSLYYYFGVIRTIYSTQHTLEKLQVNPSYYFVLAICLLATLVFGLFPNLIVNLL